MTAIAMVDDMEKLKALAGVTIATLQKLTQHYERQVRSITGGAALLAATRPRRTLALALHAVTTRPYATASELALAMGETESRHIGRRLSDLARNWRVVKGQARICSVSGRKAAVWSLATVPATAPEPIQTPFTVTSGLGSGSIQISGAASLTGGAGGGPVSTNDVVFGGRLDGSNPTPISPPASGWQYPAMSGVTGITSICINPAKAAALSDEAVIDKVARGEILSSAEYQVLKQYYQKLPNV